MLDASTGDVVLDAGCGDGFFLGIWPGAPVSTPMESTSRFLPFAPPRDVFLPAVFRPLYHRTPASNGSSPMPTVSWPYAGASFSLVLSITGRMNAPEFRRVLRGDGRLLVAVASPLGSHGITRRGFARRRQRSSSPHNRTFSRDFELVEQRRSRPPRISTRRPSATCWFPFIGPCSPAPIEATRVTFSSIYYCAAEHSRPRGGARHFRRIRAGRACRVDNRVDACLPLQRHRGFFISGNIRVGSTTAPKEGSHEKAHSLRRFLSFVATLAALAWHRPGLKKRA